MTYSEKIALICSSRDAIKSIITDVTDRQDELTESEIQAFIQMAANFATIGHFLLADVKAA